MKTFKIITLILLCVPVSVLIFDIYNYFDPTNFVNNLNDIIKHSVITFVILIVYFVVPVLFRTKFKTKFNRLNYLGTSNLIVSYWFKLVISFFLVGVLYLGWEYVQTQKEITKNGRYISAPVFRGYYIIDTQTGNSYDATGSLEYEFKLTNKKAE